MTTRLVFMGTPEAAVPSLQACAAAHEVSLVVTRPDRPSGRSRRLTAPAVKTVAAGLGLPIAEEIVRAHHGEIEVLSVRGRGTEVIVRLPLAEVPIGPEPAHEPAPAARADGH